MNPRNKDNPGGIASKSLYQSTIDAIDSMIHMVDRDMKLILVNKKFYQWTRNLGLALENVEGKKLFDVFPFLSKKVRNEYNRVFKTGEPLQTEEATRIGGKKIHTETKKIPIRENGKAIGIVTMVTDITERKDHEEELRSREEKFRLLFEQSNDALFLLDPAGVIIDCNQKTSELLGYPKKEIIGKHYLNFVVDKYHDHSEQQRLQLKRGLKPVSYEKEFLGRGGKNIPVEINPSPVLDRNKKLIWIYSVVRDISERKKSEQLQQTIFEISEKTFVSRDLNDLYKAIHQILGQLMNVDNFYIALYNADRELLSFPYFIDRYDPTPKPKKPGKGLTEFVLKSHQPLLLTRELSEEMERKDQIELIGTDCVSWLGIPLSTSTGETFGVLVVQSYNPDIHYTRREQDILMFVSRQIATAIERKKTEETLRETEIQFHHLQKIESIGTLVGAIAHDYNNILTSILGNAQLLDYNITDRDLNLRKYTKSIISASETAGHLVQQLLAFTREEKPFFDTIDINKIISDWLELLIQVAGDPIHLSCELSPGVHPIRGNPEKIRQVIMNLIINAQEAMPGGGTITIRTANRQFKKGLYRETNQVAPGNYVQLTIQDTGIGIEKHMIQEIFKPFFSKKKQGTGTGLGLSIVKRIIEEMGAFIMVDSALGHGTTVTILFPSHKHTRGEKQVKETQSVFLGNGEVILLVEDDDDVRHMLKNLLEDHLGYHTMTAQNGKKALDLLENNRVSMVITDIKMPDMDGITLLTTVRNKFPYLDGKIIAITAFSENQESSLLELGFQKVIKKPIRIDAFSAIIRNILSPVD